MATADDQQTGVCESEGCQLLYSTGWFDYCIKYAIQNIEHYEQIFPSDNATLVSNGQSTSKSSNATETKNFRYNCDCWWTRLRLCIILWDVLLCLTIHVIAAVVCLFTLGRHRIGIWYSAVLFLSTLIHPITVAAITAYIISRIAEQFQPAKLDYSNVTAWAPFYALVIALVLNVCLIISSFFTRRTLRFI